MWQEVFVGAVSVATGLFLVVAAWLDSNWLFSLPKPKRLVNWWGRNGARVFLVVLGLGLVALGVAIAMGFGPNKGAGVGARTLPAHQGVSTAG